MRRTMTILLLPAVLAACPQPQNGFTASDEAAIRSAGEMYATAVREQAWDRWGDIYAPDAILLPPNEPAVTGRDAILAWPREFPQFSRFELNIREIQGRGDLAYVYGTYDLSMTPPDAPEMRDTGKYIEIWRRQADGSWQMTHDIFNSDLGAPAGP